jgi:carbonic anhydrase
MLRPKLDLGVPALLREAATMFRSRDLLADLGAGFTVACVAVPLSLAIALASGVSPGVGIITAIVGGIVGALFGGSRLAVSGPAAAMAILIATIVQEHGLAALLVVGVGAGLLQLATGVFRLGRFVRLVPLPVVEGFTAGIGAIILIGQLPRALGLPPPAQSHVFDVVTHILDLLHKSSPAAIAVNLLTLAVIYGLPRVTKRVPSMLAAVVVATVVAASLGLGVATIGEIPRSLPAPSLPGMPTGVAVSALVSATLAVFALASLETLLSASAVEKLAPGERTDPDQELIGQGLGNIASAMFGGIPITGVIARSATNVQAGGKTRRSAVIHSLVLIVAVLALAPVMAQIPIAALAGVLFAVAARMLSPVAFVRMWRHSRADGAIYALTFAVIVFVDLLEGVQWGVAAALVIAAVKLGRSRTRVRGVRAGEHYVFALEGPVTFLSSLDVENLRSELEVLDEGRGVLLDVRDVNAMDASGAEMLAGVVEHARSLGLRPVVVGLRDEHRAKFLGSAREDLSGCLAATEGDAVDRLETTESQTADIRLRAGVERYRRGTRPRYKELFSKLADGQKPHTLFVTCADSRITPNLITGTEPGELFIVRNVGNLVPADGTLAALEYAVGVLGVGKIVICGHSGCGAIKALVSGAPLPEGLTNLHGWLADAHVRPLIEALPRSLALDDVSRMNVLAQIDHLREHPLVAARVAEGKLSLAAWFFDVGSGDLEEWSTTTQRFAPIGEGPPSGRVERVVKDAKIAS